MLMTIRHIVNSRQDGGRQPRRAFFLLSAACCLLLSGCFKLGTQSPAPAVSFGVHGGADSAGVHTVSSSDTLWSVAQRYRLSVQDIIYVNHLQAPYNLTVMQRLKLPPPTTYTVKEGDTLYGISRTFNVSPSQVARLNKLREPYAVQVGQALDLPSARPVYNPPPVVRPQKVGKGKVPAQKSPVKTAALRKSSMPPRASSKFMWPVDGPVISSYGSKKGGQHNDGINIKMPRGAPVRSADNGTVVYAGNELKGYGKLVLIRHADRWVTAYAHMDRILVKKGQVVRQGESIGTVGSTGSVDSPQLHFETRRGTEAINPTVHLSRRGI